MTQIDTTFLKVHPLTELWWRQRDTCAKCKFCEITPAKTAKFSGGSGGGWQCLKAEANKGWNTCINARGPGMPCGPDGMMFWPKQKETA